MYKLMLWDWSMYGPLSAAMMTVYRWGISHAVR